MSDQTSTGIFGNPSASTDTYNIDWTTTCGCNYWPCICRGWGVWPWQPYVAKQYVELPPLWAKPNEAKDEKARRIVVELIVKGDFYPKDKEHLEKVIQIVKEGL